MSSAQVALQEVSDNLSQVYNSLYEIIEYINDSIKQLPNEEDKSQGNDVAVGQPSNGVAPGQPNNGDPLRQQGDNNGSTTGGKAKKRAVRKAAPAPAPKAAKAAPKKKK